MFPVTNVVMFMHFDEHTGLECTVKMFKEIMMLRIALILLQILIYLFINSRYNIISNSNKLSKFIEDMA